MIKYNLLRSEHWYPQIIFEDKYEYDNKTWKRTNLCNAITTISWKEIREIIQELEEVVAWTRDDCMFWFETTFIQVYKKWIKNEFVNFPNWKVFILYNYLEDEIETDLKPEEILKMMRDWRDYIDAWEKETGKIKK